MLPIGSQTLNLTINIKNDEFFEREYPQGTVSAQGSIYLIFERCESSERDGILNLKKKKKINFQDFNFLFFMTSSLFLKIGVNCFGAY